MKWRLPVTLSYRLDRLISVYLNGSVVQFSNADEQSWVLDVAVNSDSIDNMNEILKSLAAE